MPIARRGTPAAVVQDTSGTAVTCTLPAGIVTNDVIVLVLHNNTQAAVSVGPSGYTLIRRTIDSTTLATDVWYKVATSGSEVAPTVTLGATAKWITHVAAYSGVDTTAPFFSPMLENGAGETVTGTAHTTPAVVNSDANAWAVVTYATRGGTAATWTASAETPELLDNTNTASSQLSVLLADSNGTVTAASHAYTATSTFSSGTATMWLGYLKPAAAAGGLSRPRPTARPPMHLLAR